MADNKKQTTIKKTQSKKNKQPVKKRRARRGTRNKYEYWISKDGLILLEGWARDGLSDEQIAKNIGIARTTLYDWKNKYSDIRDILKKGKEVIDFEVENALLKRALGYEYEEVKEEYENGKLVRVNKTKKREAPSTTAQIFWLINRSRRTGKWQNTRTNNVNVNAETNEILKSVGKQLVEAEINLSNQIDTLDE